MNPGEIGLVTTGPKDDMSQALIDPPDDYLYEESLGKPDLEEMRHPWLSGSLAPMAPWLRDKSKRSGKRLTRDRMNHLARFSKRRSW